MNGAIAYTIAKNQAGRFLGRQITEQEIVVTTPLLDASGKPVRKKMVPVLDEFGNEKRVARFESFDVKGKDEDGKPSQTSPIEKKIVMTALPPEVDDPALDKLTRSGPLLRRLVDSWMVGSAKRIVGEALLEDARCTVRDFPGMPKSTACRVRKVVLEAFRALQEGGVGQNQ
jgi:hypothetical protein